MGFLVWLFVLIVFLPQSLAAQTVSAKGLSETEKTGLKLFLQRCSVCHLGTPPRYETYGPLLHKELVAERGDGAVRENIMEGSPRMPGWKYTLKTADVDKIIAYLKTVTKKEVVRQSPSPGRQESND